ncbi:Rapid ALkalinization Factor [Corchorus olitorius]|uniref:Rapid ALkalinization Factor n=1 Tax=Corchorus olitorius TaxID=93759 RepID=A0A1R3JJH3_9ROSI|nr:Rapid ALkalinization Factor [Corchorus olitorius]
MGFSKVKAWLICIAVLISMMMVAKQAEAAAATIKPGVLDPCERPGGPHPGCHPNVHSPPQQANPYQRGCLKLHRCRRGKENN